MVALGVSSAAVAVIHLFLLVENTLSAGHIRYDWQQGLDMSIDRAKCFRVPEDFPVNAVVSAIVGTQSNIGGGMAFAIRPSLFKAFGIRSDQHQMLEATVDGEIVLTKTST